MPDPDLAISCERIYKSSASSTAYIYISPNTNFNVRDSLDDKIAEVHFMISLDCGHIKK